MREWPEEDVGVGEGTSSFYLNTRIDGNAIHGEEEDFIGRSKVRYRRR